MCNRYFDGPAAIPRTSWVAATVSPITNRSRRSPIRPRQGSWQYASAPDVPFCATARVAMAVVLARCSASEGGRSGVPQHRLPSAVLYALQSGQTASALAPVAAPGTALMPR
jgi:hypothetical protein